MTGQMVRSALGKYVEHVRKASGASRQARGPRKRTDTSAVRAWAKERGMEINVTCATVIPVLFLAVAVQGVAYAMPRALDV